jgi:hypothetical protein
MFATAPWGYNWQVHYFIGIIKADQSINNEYRFN